MKYILSSFLLLFLSSYVQGQEKDSRFKFGAKAGINLSFLTHDIGPFNQPDETYSSFKRNPRPSANIGVTLNVQMPKKFNFGVELLFNTQGATYVQENEKVQEEDDQGVERNAKNYYNYNIDYLELPLTVNYNFKSELSNTYIIGYAGIAPALAINHKTRLKYPKKDPDHHNQKADLPDIKSFNNNIITGVQLGEHYGSMRELYMDLRGTYMLSPVFSRSVNNQGESLYTHMYTFTLAFGIKF